MSDGLVPKDVRARHATAISEAETFETLGVSRKTAMEFLRSPEGTIFRQRLIEADPGATAIHDRGSRDSTNRFRRRNPRHGTERRTAGQDRSRRSASSVFLAVLCPTVSIRRGLGLRQKPLRLLWVADQKRSAAVRHHGDATAGTHGNIHYPSPEQPMDNKLPNHEVQSPSRRKPRNDSTH